MVKWCIARIYDPRNLGHRKFASYMPLAFDSGHIRCKLPLTSVLGLYIRAIHHLTIIAERRERSERSEANNRVLFEIPRYLYIYICLSARTLHKIVDTLYTQVLSRRPLCIWNTGCCSEHHFEECQSPFR